jgi:DeoR family suf operon transcriptional repressor
MSETRERILRTLLNHSHATIDLIAHEMNMNAISVRHHLTSLQVDGVIKAEEERHGVGRPHLVYSLTEKGLELFPTRYLRLTNRLLDQLKSSMPEKQVKSLFSQMAADMAHDYAEKVKGLGIEARLEYIKKLLAEEGFTLEWEKHGDTYHIHEVTCPYYHIGQAHPEICSIDQTLISSILEIPAEKIQCVLSGDKQCTFRIPDIISRKK